MGDDRRRGREAESGNARLALEAHKNMETTITALPTVLERTNRPSLRLSSTVLAPDAWAYSLYGGAEVVGGDGEGRELVRGYSLLEVAEVYGAAHAD